MYVSFCVLYSVLQKTRALYKVYNRRLRYKKTQAFSILPDGAVHSSAAEQPVVSPHQSVHSVRVSLQFLHGEKLRYLFL
jgi:hypothetical protein